MRRPGSQALPRWPVAVTLAATWLALALGACGPAAVIAGDGGEADGTVAPDGGVADGAVDAVVMDAAVDTGVDAGPIRPWGLGPETSLGVVGEKIDAAAEADGDLHIVYVRGYEVYYLRQVNGVWESAERLVPGTGFGSFYERFYPRLAVDSLGDAHIVWARPDMMAVDYVRFVAASETWTTPETVITDGYGDPDTNRYTIAVAADDRVVVAAQSDFAIEYALRPAGGTFATEGIIFHDDPTEPQFPALAASAVTGTFHCAYADNTPTEGLRYSVFDGTDWQGGDRPAGDGGGCCVNWGTLAVDPQGRADVAWIVWTDARGFGDLKVVRQDGAGGWSAVQTLVAEADRFDCPWDECPIPRVAHDDSGDTVLVYAEAPGGVSSVVYLLREPGAPWPTSATPVTTGSGYQNHPAVATVGDTFHLFWTDERAGGAVRHRALRRD